MGFSLKVINLLKSNLKQILWLGFQSVFFYSLLYFASCARNDKPVETSYIRACVLNEDQSSTLLGRWPLAPLKLAFDDASQFTAQEKDIAV